MTALQLALAIMATYIICVAVTAKALRQFNNPGRAPQRRVPAAMGWISLALAPAVVSLAVVTYILWSLADLGLLVCRGIAEHTHMGNSKA